MGGQLDPGSGGRFSVRVSTDADLPAVRRLVAADRLPGEPPLPDHLPEVPTAGKVFTLTGTDGQAHGVACLSVRRSDDAGLVHWLHAGEDLDAVAALLAFARAELGRRTLHAFTAPATATRVPGLPMRHRPATARALTAAGFTLATAQEYLLRDLNDPKPAAPDDLIAHVTPLEDFRGWRLVVPGPGTTGVVASAVLSCPHPTSGMAVLWHLAVHPEHRHHGIGHRLLAQSLNLAAASSARYLAAFTDPDEESAMRLLAAQDFDHVDTLAVHHRRP
ncbi:GNAT family N-acetyltransferase [Streptomyces sp. CA-251387]|uniref:GNAT family N-acetyltransferase n=1 Tax=Streptomyces sp. CA-251387 TaxID=3240064 RepID=UPI003D92571D